MVTGCERPQVKKGMCMRHKQFVIPIWNVVAYVADDAFILLVYEIKNLNWWLRLLLARLTLAIRQFAIGESRSLLAEKNKTLRQFV